MATRLYFVATTAPSITPGFDGGWTSTTGAVRRTLSTTQAAATEQVTSDIGATGPAYTLSGQFVSPPLAAQTITGTFWITTRGRELAGTDNVNKRARAVKVYDSAGSLRGTLSAWAATSSITELSATTLQGQATATNAAVSSLAVFDGDVIVVEVGFGVGTSGTTPQSLTEWGGTGTDHANTNADVTGSVPWVEFSADLTWQTGTVTGALAGTLPALTADVAGAVEVTGTTAVTLPALTAGLAGGVEVTGTVSAALPALTAAASGSVEVAGTLAATLPALTAALAGGVASSGVSGAVDAVLPSLTATAAGTVTASGTLTGTLPALTVELLGAVEAAGTLAATLPSLTADLAGGLAGLAVKATSVASVADGTSTPAVTGQAAAATVTAARSSTAVLTARRTSTPEVTHG